MAIRGIWIISTTPEKLGIVQYSRKFPTVEKRAEITHGDEYVTVPSAESFAMSVMFTLGLTDDSKQFVEWRDKASQVMQLPAIAVKIGKKELWPILIIEQVSCLLCCFPFVEKANENNLLNIPAVSVGFSVLLGILNFIGPSNALKSKVAEKFLDLDNYLTLSMPFGTPWDSEPLSIIDFYNSSSASLSKKHSSSHEAKKIKASITLEINEFVRSSQCDHQDGVPVVDVYGSIIATVNSGVHTNDVSVTLTHLDSSKTLCLKSLILHPCVQTFTSTGGEGVATIPKKLWFIPPNHRFTLCFYSVPFSTPPIKGIFKLKGDTSVELLIQLKLTDEGHMQNSFESCDIFIPFFNRGPILNFEYKSTQGVLQVVEDKHSLKWNLGTKFSSKVEAMLTAKIDFSEGVLLFQNDTFCINKNSYVQVNFKQKNTTISGCSITAKSVVMSPASKAKIQIEHNVYSSEYRIWNTFGDLPYPKILEEELPKEVLFLSDLHKTACTSNNDELSF